MPLKIQVEGTNEEKKEIKDFLSYYLLNENTFVRHWLDSIVLGEDYNFVKEDFYKKEVEVIFEKYKLDEKERLLIKRCTGDLTMSLKPVKEKLEFKSVPLLALRVHLTNKDFALFSHSEENGHVRVYDPFIMKMFYDPVEK